MAPPVLRIPYVWFVDQTTNADAAVLMMIGDKTDSGNDWYPAAVNRIDNGSMVVDWERMHANHRARVRRPR
jgi:hypothetical protein